MFIVFCIPLLYSSGKRPDVTTEEACGAMHHNSAHLMHQRSRVAKLGQGTTTCLNIRTRTAQQYATEYMPP